MICPIHQILSQSSRNAAESSKEKGRKTQAPNVFLWQQLRPYCLFCPILTSHHVCPQGQCLRQCQCYTAGKALGPNLLSVLLTHSYAIFLADPVCLVWGLSLLQNLPASPTLPWWAQGTPITSQLGTAPLGRIIHFLLQASRPQRGIAGQADCPLPSSPYSCSTLSLQALNLLVARASITLFSLGPVSKHRFIMVCSAVGLQSKTTPCASTATAPGCTGQRCQNAQLQSDGWRGPEEPLMCFLPATADTGHRTKHYTALLGLFKALGDSSKGQPISWHRLSNQISSWFMNQKAQREFAVLDMSKPCCSFEKSFTQRCAGQTLELCRLARLIYCCSSQMQLSMREWTHSTASGQTLAICL